MDKKDIQYFIKKSFSFLNDKTYLKIAYFLKFKEILNLENPITLNEKIQWIKLNDRRKEYNQLVDKLTVKKYVKEKIGEEYIIPTLRKWDNISEINFDELPQSFVLKCNHDSGGVIVCKNKNKLDKEKTKKILEKHMKRNYFWHGREWAYKDVEPAIFAEKYIATTDGSDLKDYKFFCFHGKVKYFKVDCDRFSNHKAYYFDYKKEILPFSEKVFKPDETSQIPSLPNNIDKMIFLAEKLTEELLFCRVDFYSLENKVFFGEFTLYPGSGMDVIEPKEWDVKLGKFLNLEKRRS